MQPIERACNEVDFQGGPKGIVADFFNRFDGPNNHSIVAHKHAFIERL